ncbi:methyl-accepting chemotaxis protein [Paraburkholderia silviterrae]|uniref:Methyl-accepting chemotaxis protein n=2 Tax=Paraburkholderia silviterrae TaxID=2528715 RepID=A0A4R5M5C9_9BURK|nr:methyl-accepting chemotaxis protein [Paraburkholderia silviterrae]
MDAAPHRDVLSSGAQTNVDGARRPDTPSRLRTLRGSIKMAQTRVITRLAAGFGVVLTMLVALSVVGMASMTSIRSKLDDIVLVHDAETMRATNLRGAVSGIAIAIRNMAVMTNEKDVEAEQSAIKAQEASYAENYRALGRLFDASPLTTAQERRLFAALRDEEAQTLPLVEKEAMNWALANDQDAALKVLVNEVRPRQVAWLATLDQLLALEQGRAHDAADAAAATWSRLALVTVAAVFAALCVGVAAAVLITRSILRQLGGDPGEAQRLASEIAGGNLAVAVVLRPNDNRSLMASLETMRLQLVSIVGQIKTSAESIAVRAGEIATGNLDLSQRTDEQAASLQQAAASMAELTSAVTQSSDDAAHASTVASAASDAAGRGGELVGRVISTMEDIAGSSARVEEIIGVIEGIAFQTNILALNAAVEAARAGAEGRGFAVVAGEVRTLAQRTALAAKEVKALVGESAGHVEAGSRLVADAGERISGLVRSVHEFTGIMSNIATACAAQKSDIEQVNRAVTEMDEATQRNAALVEQVAGAAQTLAGGAAGLREAVAVFNIAGVRSEARHEVSDSAARCVEVCGST